MSGGDFCKDCPIEINTFKDQEEILKWATQGRVAGFSGEPTMVDDLTRWWVRGINGSIDLVSKKSEAKKFGPRTKQHLKDAVGILMKLTQQPTVLLTEAKHDEFVLEGLVLLCKHLDKYGMTNDEVLRQLGRLLKVEEQQT